MKMSKLDDLMSMEELARKVKMNRDRLRRRCIDAGIAIHWGGPQKHPRLKAKLADVEKMILNDRFIEQQATRRQVNRRPKVKTHPLINC